MTKESKQYKIFGRRKGKKLSNLQRENLNNYINDFSIFKTNHDGVLSLRKINPKELFYGIEDIRLEIGFGMGDFLFEKAKNKIGKTTTTTMTPSHRRWTH